MGALGTAILVFLLAWCLTLGYLRTVGTRFVDVPGHRSSHQRPTPTGGGLGMALAVMAGVLVMPGSGADWYLPAVLACCLGVVGLVDDVRGLPVAPRLLAQFLAATALVTAVGALPDVVTTIDPRIAVAITVLMIVWLVNIFNFMDGIDGLAAGHAVFMSLAAAVLVQMDSSDSSRSLACIAAAAMGFLLFNWQPARLFMGDAGSLSLGFLLAAATVLTVTRGEITLSAWAVLWSPLLCDTSVCLLRRAWRGESLLSAHRGHAYQRLARAWHSHARVVLGLLLVDFLWLFPLAALTQIDPAHALAWAGLAITPVLLSTVWFVFRID